jgi:hypothetical protein
VNTDTTDTQLDQLPLSSDFSGESSHALIAEVRRWTTCEIIAGSASLVLLVSLFTPWFHIGLVHCPPLASASCQAGVLSKVDGLTVHAYLWAVLPPTAAILTLLVLNAGLHPVPVTRRSAYRLALAAAAGVNLILVLVAFRTLPGFVALPPHPAATLARPVLDTGWEYGADLAVATAIVALAAATLNAIMARSVEN